VKWQSDRGIALVVALMTLLLLTAVGAALTLTASVESLTAASYRGGLQALYAADAAAEWALTDLAAVVPDWPTLLGGSISSGFVDGPPTGTRTLADGSVVDLTHVFASASDWRPYAFGPLERLLPPSAQPSHFYVVVLVSPDPDAPDRINVRTEAFGTRGAHKALEIKVSRRSAGVKLETWREVR